MDSVSFDTLKCARRLEGVIERRQKILDPQVADDSNYYAPEAEGDLKESVILSSKMGSGVLVWGVSYGREQYYEKPNKSKDKNPNARGHWFDFAKSVRLKEWLTIANGGG
jgi:hypothetical protein